MFWQFRRDFISLYTSTKNNKNHLDSIDGLRSIANLSIIFLHISIILNAFVPSYPHIEWQKYLESVAFAFTSILVLTLEIFFILSGFLLTYKLIVEWNKNFPCPKSFLYKEYPISIIKRVLRFWPGMLLATLIMFIFGEPRDPNNGLIFEYFRHFSSWIFCQNYIGVQYFNITFSPLWSISLDMQIHIILPLILYLFYSYKNVISVYNSLSILLLISIIQGLIVFDPVTMPILPILYRYPSLPVSYRDYVTHWLQTNYNVTFSFHYVTENAVKLFLNKMYFPLEARFGSFIIGAMLAIKLLESTNHDNKPRKLKKFVFFTLICFQIFIMIQPSTLSIPPDIVLTLAIASSRQLFAIGQAFILFTTLCPTSHPYHSSWIKKFLSLSIWSPISKLSYLVYIIHWRISFELIFGGPLRFLQMYSVTYATLISLFIVLLITQSISIIWYILIEKPVERTIQKYFHKNHVD